MHRSLPTELYLPARPGSVGAVEHICALATSRAEGDAVAVAVSPANVSRASNLLFGTGVGVVGTLEDDEPDSLISLARLSVATGANEVALPRMVLDEAAVVHRLKSFLGSATPLTVDITSTNGDADLADAEHALVLGADFVAFAPSPTAINPAGQTANLVALAGELQLGGVKVATGSDHHLTVLRSNEWAMEPGNARRCLPVAPPMGDLRP